MRLQRTFVMVSLVAGLLVAALRQPAPVAACAAAPHSGETVGIADESAMIVWDPKSKTEHFIRRASFETRARDFGFLVPTPTQPDLGEVADDLFDSADRMTRARVVHETIIKTAFGFGLLPTSRLEDSAPSGAAFAPTGSKSSVEVLDQKQVAGFDATVLRADDHQALAGWLDKHGYESRPALTEWLKWYVEHRWIITAFKLVKDGNEADQFGTRSIRMSFHADRPFYPYREPEDMRGQSRGGSRWLRLFFLADQRYQGTLGDSGTWPASTKWARPVAGHAHTLISPLKLKDSDFEKTVQGAWYLTEFLDKSTPRPGTDEVYFHPSANQSIVERPPIIITKVEVKYWPGRTGAVALPLMLALGVFGYGYRRRLARSAKLETPDNDFF